MSAELPKMRQDFEAWVLTSGECPMELDFDVDEAGHYVWASTILAYACWQEAARQAIERCAEVCDDQEEPAWYGYENPNTFDDGKRACASAIRALTHESEKRHGH